MPLFVLVGGETTYPAASRTPPYYPGGMPRWARIRRRYGAQMARVRPVPVAFPLIQLRVSRAEEQPAFGVVTLDSI